MVAFIGTQASGIDNEHEYEHDLKTPATLRLSLMGVMAADSDRVFAFGSHNRARSRRRYRALTVMVIKGGSLTENGREDGDGCFC
jgi:hypothetical protein